MIELALQWLALLFIFFVFVAGPAFLFYSLGGWPCAGLWLGLVSFRKFVDYVRAE